MTKQLHAFHCDFVPNWEHDETQYLSPCRWSPNPPPHVSVQALWRDDALIFRLCSDTPPSRAVNTAQDSSVWEDSCLEFFFMPDGGDRYFNFEINPNGCLYIEFGHNRSDRFVLYRSDIPDRFDIRTARTEDGWEIFYQIPLEFIRLFYPEFEFSGALRANVYKCGDQTVKSHYLSWNPITSEKPDFHRPEDFGIMHFTD